MGKQSRRSREWPDWTSYIDSSKSMTKIEMLRHALAKMPVNHPERERVQQRATAVATANAEALTADVERSKAAKAKRGKERATSAKEQTEARAADRPWETSEPFLPYDTEEEARTLEQMRTSFGEAHGCSIAAAPYKAAAFHCYAMSKGKYLSTELSFKILTTQAERGGVPDLTKDEWATFSEAWRRYQEDNPEASGPGPVEASAFNAAHIRDMFEYGYLPKSIFDKVDPVVQRTPLESRHLDLTDVLTLDEGYTMVAAYEQFKKDILGPSVEKELRETVETDLTGKQIVDMFDYGYVPGSLLKKMRPAFEAGGERTDLCSVLTQEESDKLLAAFERYKKDILGPSPNLPPVVEREQEEWRVDEMAEVLRSGLLSDALVRKISTAQKRASDGQVHANLTLAETTEWRTALKKLKKRNGKKSKERFEPKSKPAPKPEWPPPAPPPPKPQPEPKKVEDMTDAELAERMAVLEAEHDRLLGAEACCRTLEEQMTSDYANCRAILEGREPDPSFVERCRRPDAKLHIVGPDDADPGEYRAGVREAIESLEAEGILPMPNLQAFADADAAPPPPPPPPETDGVQVVYSEQTIPEADDGTGHSGFRGAIAQALGALNLDKVGAGSSATVLDFTLGEDGSMKVDTASARDLDNVHTTAELVTRVQEEVDKRDGAKKREAELHDRRRERAATIIQCAWRAILLWPQKRTVDSLTELINAPEIQGTDFLVSAKLMSDLANLCGLVGRQRQEQSSLDFMRKGPSADAVLKWVREHGYIPPELIRTYFLGPHVVRTIGQNALLQLFCGIRLLDSDPSPETMLAYSKSCLFDRIKAICAIMALPEIGFEEIAMKTHINCEDDSEVHERKVFFMRAFMAIEARIGRCFTNSEKLWRLTVGKLMRMIDQKREEKIKNARFFLPRRAEQQQQPPARPSQTSQRGETKRKKPPPPPPPPPPPSPKDTHRLGDRMMVMTGTAICTKVRVVEMKFDAVDGQHVASLLEVMWSQRRELIGKHLTSNNVTVIEVLTDFKYEWQRIRWHARMVGKATTMFGARLDKVHRRHEKEAAKRLREHAPRRCRECDERRPRDAYSTSQWAKPEGKRTCTPCQDAAKAEVQRAKDEAARLAMEELLNSECAVCYGEAIASDDRAIFACAHWICRDCASELHLRNELHACPLCRHPILDPQQHVVA